MDLEIKKTLTSNWFKMLQNSICDTIIKLENKKVKFESTFWSKSKKKMKVEVSIESYKMGKFLIKLE